MRLQPCLWLQALNDLFEKIMQRDVPARYLLRLGMGEQELRTEQDFSRVGRVNAMLERRIQLLAEVRHQHRLWQLACDCSFALSRLRLCMHLKHVI